jgi:hypothetical protein
MSSLVDLKQSINQIRIKFGEAFCFPCNAHRLHRCVFRQLLGRSEDFVVCEHSVQRSMCLPQVDWDDPDEEDTEVSPWELVYVFCLACSLLRFIESIACKFVVVSIIVSISSCPSLMYVCSTLVHCSGVPSLCTNKRQHSALISSSVAWYNVQKCCYPQGFASCSSCHKPGGDSAIKESGTGDHATSSWNGELACVGSTCAIPCYTRLRA